MIDRAKKVSWRERHCLGHAPSLRRRGGHQLCERAMAACFDPVTRVRVIVDLFCDILIVGRHAVIRISSGNAPVVC